MHPDFFRYLKKNLIATAILAFLGWLVFSFFIKEFYFQTLPFLLLFFCLFSMMVQYFLYKIAKMNVGKFTSRFMAVTMLKLFVLLILALVFIFINKKSAIPFIVVYFVLYVVYTALEVSDIMPVTGKN